MATSRVRRGRKSQDIAAESLHSIFPDAEGLAASLGGRDIRHTDNWAFELKATKDFKPTEFLRQADANAKNDWPVAVYRPKGYGEAKVDLWIAMMSFGKMRELIAYVRELEARVAELSDRTGS